MENGELALRAFSSEMPCSLLGQTKGLASPTYGSFGFHVTYKKTYLSLNGRQVVPTHSSIVFFLSIYASTLLFGQYAVRKECAGGNPIRA